MLGPQVNLFGSRGSLGKWPSCASSQDEARDAGLPRAATRRYDAKLNVEAEDMGISKHGWFTRENPLN